MATSVLCLNFGVPLDIKVKVCQFGIKVEGTTLETEDRMQAQFHFGVDVLVKIWRMKFFLKGVDCFDLSENYPILFSNV